MHICTGKLPRLRKMFDGNRQNKIICVVGPTASGKSDLAVKIAKKFDGEIISCDSMRLYRGMDIGTAKPTNEEKQGIEHHLLDFVEPSQRYSVAEFKKDAEKAIEIILSKGKTPIIAGGTGLYVDSLILSFWINFV